MADIDTRRPAGLNDDQAWDEFIQGRAAEYEMVQDRYGGRWHIPKLEYLGMTGGEYAAWFLTGFVAERVRRAWSKPAR
jgi:hypothetical protein